MTSDGQVLVAVHLCIVCNDFPIARQLQKEKGTDRVHILELKITIFYLVLTEVIAASGKLKRIIKDDILIS